MKPALRPTPPAQPRAPLTRPTNQATPPPATGLPKPSVFARLKTWFRKRNAESGQRKAAKHQVHQQTKADKTMKKKAAKSQKAAAKGNGVDTICLTSTIDDSGRITSKVTQRVGGETLEIEVAVGKDTGTRGQGEADQRRVVKDIGRQTGEGVNGDGASRRV